MVKPKGWTCSKPELKEVLCLPTTRKKLIPGYNFETSTRIGMQHILPLNDYFEVKPLTSGKDKSPKTYQTLKHHYKTSSSNHDVKRISIDPLNQANRISGTKCLFIKEFEEKSRRHEVDKMSDPISTYKTEYKMHPYDPELCGTTVDRSNKIFCKIKGITKNEQPKVDLSSTTLLSILDNYVTTHQTSYPYISQDRRDFFMSPKQKFAVKKEKNPSRIFEEHLFRFRFLDRLIPKQVDRVPNGGIITENQKEFKSKWGEIYKKPKQIYLESVPIRATKQDVMKIPGMYTTDYSHYGSNISPNKYV